MVIAELLPSPAYGHHLPGGGQQSILFDQHFPPLSIATFVNLRHPLIWAFSSLTPVCRRGRRQKIIGIVSKRSFPPRRPSITTMTMRPLEQNDVINIYLACTGCWAACVWPVTKTAGNPTTIEADLSLAVSYQYLGSRRVGTI